MRFGPRARYSCRSPCVSLLVGRTAREHALVLKVPDCEYGRRVFFGHAHRRVCVARARQWVAVARARRQRVEKVIV